MATYATAYRRVSTLEVEVRHQINEIHTTRENLRTMGTELIMDRLSDLDIEILLEEYEQHCFNRHFDPGVEGLPMYGELVAEQLSRSC